MTNDEAIKEFQSSLRWAKLNTYPYVSQRRVEAINMAIKALEQEATERYKPVILQEHDAEPRKFKAILDMETDDIYIRKTTKAFAESIGMTIEDRNVDEESEDKK